MNKVDAPTIVVSGSVNVARGAHSYGRSGDVVAHSETSVNFCSETGGGIKGLVILNMSWFLTEMVPNGKEYESNAQIVSEVRKGLQEAFPQKMLVCLNSQMCAAVDLESFGICDKDNSTDVCGEGSGGVCDEGNPTDVGVECNGDGCDEGNVTDVGVGGSGVSCDEDYLTDVGVQGSPCVLEISPGLTKYWRPVCADNLKPIVGQQFVSLDSAIVFYKQYAGSVGFHCRHHSIRKSRDGVAVEKHLVCNRQDFKQRVSSVAKTTLVTRRRVTNRVGCKAKVVIKLKSNGLYVVHSFEERHTHSLCSIIARKFLKVNRSLDVGHQMFIASCAQANIGSVRSYRLFKEIVGEYYNVGATGVDFKNFKRDLMAYILNGDAQLFIDTLFKRRELCEAFDFEYDVDEVDQLSRVFWADAISRKNFALFGDVVSFDATYRTYRYKLVFVPFTGIDNHKRSITFGADLLTREDVDSYVWLLEKFKKTMCHDPICVVTDQDPALKVVVARVFGTSKHRFCMWHIMCKVGEKVGPVLSKDEVFRRKLNGIVWNKSLDSKSFEDAWSYIMEEYGLGDNGWFRYLFESRTFWHPHIFTTSLCQDWLGQRLDQSLKIVFLTPLALEKHAMGVYTISVFYDVQVEICAACYSCQVVSLCDCDGHVSYGIKDGAQRAWCVELVLSDYTATYSCKMFERMGLLCRHILFVFKDRGLESILSRYLVSRWTKGACLKPIFHIDDTIVDQSSKVENVRIFTNLLWSDIYACVGLADGNIERLAQLRRVICEQRQLFLQDGSENGSGVVAGGSKQSVINLFCGAVSQGSTVEVRDPIQAKNKGSGKRLKSTREKATSKCVKQSRKCHTCDEYGHNSRTCPLNG
ncbi:PREDICTED: protein FAR1-RELATED SEQUENCE 5-like [Ipomoea nil]|uniref:protein FAR1-RELATED SEQUENCE 5-like n=1 Tax=Ipomoea nil TaxID=35883 RepID=UPI00090152B5|nr:PREDICTED: protein FAR1-RELATED SEQUENCE 5-like [Ipomoea nil]